MPVPAKPAGRRTRWRRPGGKLVLRTAAAIRDPEAGLSSPSQPVRGRMLFQVTSEGRTGEPVTALSPWRTESLAGGVGLRRLRRKDRRDQLL
jgi:hypothetical protein